MGYIIGTDEAGYGPNLGPLVISATVWQSPDGVGGEDLFGTLAGAVANSLPKKAEKNGLPVFADSKILYKSGGHLKLQPPHGPLCHLERGLWAAWSLMECNPTSGHEVWNTLAPGCLETIEGCDFFGQFDQPLPRDIFPFPSEVEPDAKPEWRTNFEKSGVKLLAIRSRAVFPAEFNRLMDEHDSKGAALSHLTLSLAAELIRPLEKGPISVLCDKHGGRDRYAALLTDHFPDGFVEVLREGRQQSVYRFGPPDRRVEFQFRAKAESCLPAALASMASKYLRELAMDAFNAFWTAQVPDLAPTAGYPQDARRFLDQIAPKQRELKIDDSLIWRKK